MRLSCGFDQLLIHVIDVALININKEYANVIGVEILTISLRNVKHDTMLMGHPYLNDHVDRKNDCYSNKYDGS